MSTFTAFGDVYTRLGELETTVGALETTLEGGGPGGTPGVYSGTNPFDINVDLSADFADAWMNAVNDRIAFLKQVTSVASENVAAPAVQYRNGQILRLVNLGGASADAKKYTITLTITDASPGTQVIDILPGEAYSLVFALNLLKFLVVPGIINGGYSTAYTPPA
jgi:hypothetical protein